MKRTVTTLLALVLIATCSTAYAAREQEQTMRVATSVINDFVNIPENAIPSALLSKAYGIAVIPGVIKAGFIIGGRYGEGVLSVRTKDGTWSHPVFIDLAGASVGWQIGAASSDIILVFKSQRSVEKIINGQVTLGADASVAAGPVGRTASAATNLQLDAEIYSYSRSRGLFAGVALEGGVITIDAEADWRYYGQMVESRTILHRNDRSALPRSGQRFVYTLDQYMPPLNASGATRQKGNSKAMKTPNGASRAPINDSSRSRSQSKGNQQPYGTRAAQPAAGDSTQGQTNGRGQTYNGGKARNEPAVGNRRVQRQGRNSAGQGGNNAPAGGGNYGPVYRDPGTQSGSQTKPSNSGSSY